MTWITDVEKQDELYDAILLDLYLPLSQREETVQKAVEAYPGVPIVVLSSTGDAETQTKCLQAGAMECHVKGGTSSGLLRSIQRAVQTKHGELTPNSALYEHIGDIITEIDGLIKTEANDG